MIASGAIRLMALQWSSPMRDIVSPIDGIRSPFGPSRLVPALYLPFAMTGFLDSRITFSRASRATMYDSTGKLTYAPNNLFLNSAALSTQSVTTEPVNYIISFKGTGTITLTGTSTAGPIVGTGVANRVFLKITPTAGTLTCTVSGSVTEAQIEAVTYETSPRTYNATTSAAYYGPRFDYNPSTLAARGLLIEESRTNLCLWSQQFANAAWQSRSYVTDNFATAPDGTTTAARINSNMASDNVVQFISVTASTTYTYSFYSRNNGGTTSNYRIYNQSGLADIVPLTSYFSQINGTTFSLISVTFTTPVACTQVAVYVSAGNGPTENVIVWGAQLELGAFATSYIPTAAASVTRAADSVTMTGTNFSSWYNQSEGTFVANFALPFVDNDSPRVIGFDTAAGATPMYLSGSSVTLFNSVVNGASAAGVSTSATNKAALGYTDGVSNSMCVGGGTVGNSATDYNLGTPTALNLGSGAGSYLNGWIASLTYYNTRLPNATLQSLTA